MIFGLNQLGAHVGFLQRFLSRIFNIMLEIKMTKMPTRLTSTTADDSGLGPTWTFEHLINKQVVK